MYKAPLPSSSSLWEFPLPVLPWGTSPKHPNKIHKYEEACHPSVASKSTSQCHLALMVSSSLELGFLLNLLTNISINLTSPTNNIEIVLPKDKCPFGQLSYELI